MAASGLVIENNRTLPYGEEWLPATGSANEQKFTSYQRDGESGLDYAIHRFDATTRGVFMSADRGPISLGLPQSLNRYIYAMAAPVNYTDPDGMQPQSDDPPAYNAYAAFLDWLFTRHSQSLLTGILYGIEEPQWECAPKTGQISSKIENRPIGAFQVHELLELDRRTIAD